MRHDMIDSEGKELNTERIEYKVEGNTVLGKGPDPDDNWEAINSEVIQEPIASDHNQLLVTKPANEIVFYCLCCPSL